MGKCPFCQSPLGEDILTYGGTCPKCFGEIPGEEAATDPGEVVKAKQARSDKRRVLVRTLVPFVLAVPVVGFMLLAAVGFAIWNRDPEVQVIDFDSLDEFSEFEIDIVAAPPEAEEPDPDAPTPKSVEPGRSAPKNPGPKSPEPGDGIADAGEPKVTVPTPRPSSGGIDFGGMGVTQSRQGDVLKDPGQIIQAIGKTMRLKQGTLTQCYNKQLKKDETLSGRWRAKFTVGTNGFAKEISFSSSDAKNAEFEKCLATTVAKWKFPRIARPQPVQKSWRFRPG